MNYKMILPFWVTVLLLGFQHSFGQNLELLSTAKVIYEHELTQTAFCSDGSDRARDGKPRFHGPMEARVISYKNFQYVSYYESDGSIVVARRNLDRPDRWEKSTILGHKMVLHDRHRKIAMSISKKDGVIHLAFNHHNTDGFNYAHSAVDVANNPEKVTWDNSIFQLLPNLGLSESTGSVTYPSFYQIENSENLIVYWRTGGAVGGEMNLAHYSSSTHEWRFIGVISSREGTFNGETATRGPYTAGFKSDKQGNLYLGWLWREDAFDEIYHYGNHGLYFAYSNDGGFKWYDTNDSLIADTRKGKTISIDNIGGPVMDIPLKLEASNAAHFSAVDQKTGDYHHMSGHYTSNLSTKKTHHYIRRANGKWSVRVTSMSSGGGSLFFSEDYAIIVKGNDIYTSERKHDFSNWKRLPIDKSLPDGEGQWDASRIMDGILTYAVQHDAEALGKPSPVDLIEIRIAKDLTPEPELNFVKPSNDTNINSGYNQLHINVNASYIANSIDYVTLYVDSEMVRADSIAPYEWGNPGTEYANELLGLPPGKHTIKVIATGEDSITTTRYRDVSVWDKSLLPSINMISPEKNDSSITMSQRIKIEAEIIDKGKVKHADLFINNRLIRRIENAPFVWGSEEYANELKLEKGLNTIKIVAVNDLEFSNDTSFVINVIPERFGFPEKSWLIPGKINAVYFDLGGEGLAYHDIEEGWMGGLRSDNPRYPVAGKEDVEIEEHEGIYNIGYTALGEWLKYSIDSVMPGIYTIKIAGSSKIVGGRVVVRLGADSLGIINIPSTSNKNWTTYKEFGIENITIPDKRTNEVLQLEFTHTRYTTNLCNIRFIEFEKTGELDNNQNRASDYMNELRDVSICPNPADNIIQLKSKQAVQNVAFYNMQGRIIKSFEQPGMMNEFDVSDLIPGAYIVKVSIVSGENKVFNLIKN